MINKLKEHPEAIERGCIDDMTVRLPDEGWDGNSLRDEIKDRIRNTLVEYGLDEYDLTGVVGDIADEIFDVMEVSDEVQDAPVQFWTGR